MMLGSPLELKWNAKDLESLQFTVATYVKRRRRVVQAGGCLGVFPLWLAEQFEAVYTFEPDPALFDRLVANCSWRSNIVKFQAALGDERRFLKTVCELRGNDGKTVLHEGMTRTEPGGVIPTMRIDDLALPCCDLIYLDVEGDELYALRGAVDTIVNHRPVVGCEINRGIDYRGIPRNQIFDFMRELQYDVAKKLRSDVIFVPI